MQIYIDLINYYYNEYIHYKCIRYFIHLFTIVRDESFTLHYKLFDINNWYYINNSLVKTVFY
jgi:hypothetical protein